MEFLDILILEEYYIVKNKGVMGIEFYGVSVYKKVEIFESFLFILYNNYSYV